MELSIGNHYLPDYESEKSKCPHQQIKHRLTDYNVSIGKIAEFLSSYEDAGTNDAIHGRLKYMSRLQAIANRQEKVLKIELSDLQQHFTSAREVGFVERIKVNTARYVSLFA